MNLIKHIMFPFLTFCWTIGCLHIYNMKGWIWRENYPFTCVNCYVLPAALLTICNCISYHSTKTQAYLFAAFEAANFQIDFFGNPVMRTAE